MSCWLCVDAPWSVEGPQAFSAVRAKTHPVKYIMQRNGLESDAAVAIATSTNSHAEVILIIRIMRPGIGGGVEISTSNLI